MTRPEYRSNWEPERDLLGWARPPSDRFCRFCRRDLLHTSAEHDLVYELDRAEILAWDKAESDRQVDADVLILAGLRNQGMTEDEAAGELWRMMGRGEGLVEPTPRPKAAP